MRRRSTALAMMAAILASSCFPYDFDGDGIADLVCFDGTSFWMNGEVDPLWTPTFPGPPPPPFEEPVAVPGDYDGDGHWELAAYDRGTWETDGSAGTIVYDPVVLEPLADHDYWLPVPGNYDGTDDAWEPAFYDLLTGTWYIEGQAPIAFGIGGDVWAPGPPLLTGHWADLPVPGDYDGDYDTEIAVYRPADGTLRTLEAGIIGTIDDGLGFPVVADLDGDLADELVLFDPLWDPDDDLWRFTDGSTTLQPARPELEETGYDPLGIPADYDGDLTADLMRWFPFGGWFVSPGSPDLTWPIADTDCIPLQVPAALVVNIIRLTAVAVVCYADPADCPPGITLPS